MNNRFHILYSVHYLKRLSLLCILPLVRALFSRSLEELYAALLQNASLLILLCAASFALRSCAWWRLEDDILILCRGVFFKRETHLRIDRLSCVSVEAGPLLRVMGAARLRLYCADRSLNINLYLHSSVAAELADQLIPLPPGQKIYRPRGYDRLGLLAVSANLLTVAALGGMTAASLPDPSWAEQAARQGVDRLSAFIAPWLGAGLSGLLAVLALWGLGALVVSASRTAFYRIHYGGGVLYTSSGLWVHIDRRIRTAAISGYRLRVGPAARLFRRYPVHVLAGSYSGADLPVFLFRPTAADEMEEVLPGCRLADLPLPSLRGRSPAAFFLAPGIAFGFALILLSVSTWQLPEVSPPLGVVTLFFALLLLAAAEAFRLERVDLPPDGPPVIFYSRNFTLYAAVLTSPAAGYFLYQNPFSRAVGRCNILFTLPGNPRIRVRSVPAQEFIERWPFSA